MVESLIKAGIDISVKDKADETALHKGVNEIKYLYCKLFKVIIYISN